MDLSSEKSGRRRPAAAYSGDAEAAWRRESKLNHAVLDTVDALVVVLDRDGRIVRFNRACQATTGYSLDEVRGRSVFDLLVPTGQAAAVRDVFGHLVEGAFSNRHENFWRAKSGKQRLIAWRNTSILDTEGSVEYVVATGLDVTGERRAQAELDRNRRGLRELNARLISLQEESSRRLAREMHDSVGQKVARLAFRVSTLRSRQEAGDTEKALAAVEADLRELGADIRNVSHQLHPTILQDLGLGAAIEKECRLFSEEFGIPTTCRVDDMPAVGCDVQLALFRIAQESLGNVQRHARAATVAVTLASARGELILAVRDDGRGFDSAETGAAEGLGLTSMRERAHAVGGRLRVETTPGRGTRIEVRIPVSD